VALAARQDFVVASLSHELGSGSPGLGEAWRVFTAPAQLFRRVEDTGTYGWALVALLALVTLTGYVQVQTGLIDRVVDQQTERQLADLEKSQANLVDRVQLKDTMDAVRKSGEFMKLLRRLGAIVLSPIFMLVSFLLISSILYAAVALTGRKPEYHTLMSICVFAGFVDLAGCLLRLAMMVAYRTTAVDTSLGMLAPIGKPSWLSAVDPFRIWFWLLVALGLIVTQQLGRRGAIVWCSFLFLVASAARVGLEYAGSL
jgi:hypothetical protein